MTSSPPFDLASFLAGPRPATVSPTSRRRRAVLASAFPAFAAGPAPASSPLTPAPAATARPGEIPSHATPGKLPRKKQGVNTPLVITLSAGSLVCAVAAVVLSIGRAPAIRGDDPTRDPSPGFDAGAGQSPTRERDTSVQSTTRAPITREPDESIDASGVVRALRRASFGYRSDPSDAIARFAQAVDVLGDSWTVIDRSQRVAALELQVEFLLRSSEGRDAPRASTAAFGPLDAMLSRESLDATALLRAVWSAGVATRLLRERDLAESLRQSAQQRAGAVGVQLGSSLDASFELGAIAALRAVATRLASPSADAAPASRDAWKAWDSALLTATELNPGALPGVALDAAEAVLAAASARPSDVQLRDRLTVLLAQCDWSARGNARGRLIGWLEDHRRFATRELGVVTQWLSMNAPESGMSVNDTLSAGASSYQRSELRSRLNARWGSGQSVIAASVLDRWKVAVSLRGKEPWDSMSADPLARLREAAHIARLNEAAALLWKGEPDSARRIIDDPAGTLSTPPPGQPRLDALSPRSGDGAFAIRYLNARQNAQDRIDILRNLLSEGRELGPIDAEVVFEAAMLGTPAEVRRIAGRIVEFRASDPTVINAALESLPRAPRARAMQDIFEATAGRSLPPIEDASWVVETRRALVNRLLAILTGGASLDPADSYAAAIKESFGVRAGVTLDANATPRAAAEELVTSLLHEATAAGGLSANERVELLRRRHIARRTIATGDMQRFAAEATNAAESFALLLAVERPSREPAIEQVLTTLRDRLRSAPSVADQIEAAEFASLSLWALRFGEESPR